MRNTTRMMMMQNGIRRNQERERGGEYAGYDRPIGFEREPYEPEMRRGGRRRRNETRSHYGGDNNRWEMMRGGRMDDENDPEWDENDHFDGKKWVSKLKNADGSTGAHWDKQKSDELRLNRNMQDIEPEAFYIALNMLYSDYQPALKKFGVDRPEVYAELAKAFLMDKDGKQGMEKLKAYYEAIVK